MSSHSPTRYRREGREAFSPGEDPFEVCPYTKATLSSQRRRESFMEGWAEAERHYKQHQLYVIEEAAPVPQEVWDSLPAPRITPQTNEHFVDGFTAGLRVGIEILQTLAEEPESLNAATLLRQAELMERMVGK